MAQQLRVDTTDLDNGSWRHIVSPFFVEQTVAGDFDRLTVSFIIEGGTSDELTTRWNQTVTDFMKEGGRIIALLDDATTETVADWYPNDGLHINTATSVSWLDEGEQTNFSLHCVFQALGSKALPGGGDSYFPLAGQASAITVGKQLGAGRDEVRVVNGVFKTTFDPDAYGPFAISSISDNGGNVRFNLTGGLPTFKSGMKIDVSGTNLHNGVHVVTAITGQDVDTTQPYLGADTGGSANIGEPTTGKEHYDNARSTLFSNYLEVGTGGERDPTTKLVLIQEQTSHTNENADDLEFILTATTQEYALSTAVNGPDNVVRGFFIEYQRAQPEIWDRNFGPRPTDIIAQGTVSIDRDKGVIKTLGDWWDTIEDNVLDNLRDDNNVSGVEKILSREISLNPHNWTISFTLTVRVGWAGFLQQTKEISFADQLDFTAWSDSDGFDVLQRPKSASRKTAVSVIRRTGEGTVTEQQVRGFAEPPREAGFTWLLTNVRETRRDRIAMDASDNMAIQDFEFIFQRFKIRGGNITQVAPRV